MISHIITLLASFMMLIVGFIGIIYLFASKEEVLSLLTAQCPYRLRKLVYMYHRITASVLILFTLYFSREFYLNLMFFLEKYIYINNTTII